MAIPSSSPQTVREARNPETSFAHCTLAEIPQQYHAQWGGSERGKALCVGGGEGRIVSGFVQEGRGGGFRFSL